MGRRRNNRPPLVRFSQCHYSLAMRRTLKLHPDSRCEAATKVEVDVTRSHGDQMTFRFLVTGKIADLRLPPVTVSASADGLWRHTCFEAFVRTSDSVAYYEFNFAPSRQWAAYHFSDYRSGMSVPSRPVVPNLLGEESITSFQLDVSLRLRELPDLPTSKPWRLGLSAVLEETNGNKSYWALAHPPGKADFHRGDCFVLELPAA